MTSSPGFQMKLKPRISGCKVRTKMPTRHSGKPARTSRSQISATIKGGATTDLAPSISQSAIFLRSCGFMRCAFAAQFAETSRRQERLTFQQEQGRSPDGAKHNPGMNQTAAPDFASL